MINKALLDHDGQIATVFHHDDGETRISYHEDVSGVLDANHAFRADGQTDSEVMGRKIATIPPTIYMEWCRLSGVRVQDFMRWPRAQKVELLKKFLNDPEWYKLKTVDGRV